MGDINHLHCPCILTLEYNDNWEGLVSETYELCALTFKMDIHFGTSENGVDDQTMGRTEV